MAILIIFDLSYIVRFVFDRYSAKWTGHYTATEVIVLIFTGALVDMLPTSCILFIHSRNFNTTRFRVTGSEGANTSTDRDDFSSHIDCDLIESTNEDDDIDSIKNDGSDGAKNSEKIVKTKLITSQSLYENKG